MSAADARLGRRRPLTRLPVTGFQFSVFGWKVTGVDIRFAWSGDLKALIPEDSNTCDHDGRRRQGRS